MPAPRINDIVRERRGITADTAMRLARDFGGAAQSWLNLQTLYDLRVAEKANARKIDREITSLARVTPPEPLPRPTHSIRFKSKAVSGGWPKVISNLKSLLETGSTVLQDPYPTAVSR